MLGPIKNADLLLLLKTFNQRPDFRGAAAVRLSQIATFSLGANDSLSEKQGTSQFPRQAGLRRPIFSAAGGPSGTFQDADEAIATSSDRSLRPAERTLFKLAIRPGPNAQGVKIRH
jgi:hypothetical protein